LFVSIALRKSSTLLIVTLASFAVTSGCHAQQPEATAAPTIQLQPYTASDQSASAGVPSGWHVTKGQETVIALSGSQGETVSLGDTVIAKNGAFQLGQPGSNGIDLSMPYSATLPQKLTMIFQESAAASGNPSPQITVISATPIQLPAALCQCGRFAASFSGLQGP